MIKKSVSLTQILSKISEFHVFKRYAPTFSVGVKFFGDIGRSKQEKKPSANIIYIKNRWRYHDFAIGTFSCWDYMMAKFNISFHEALEMVDKDFGLGFSYNGNIAHHNIQYDYKNIIVPEQIQKKRAIIKIKAKEWDQSDIRFWTSVGWTGQMVSEAKITPIKAYYMTDKSGDLVKYVIKGELAFAYAYYLDADGIFQYKLYFPNRIDFKWISNVNSSTVQNIKNLPRNGNLLFITSAYKDCGQTSRLANQWNALAGNNENSFIPLKTFYKLKTRFKQIILWLDNDETGIKNMIKWSKMYNLKYMHNPLNSPKDQSALWQDIGGNGFNRVMKQQLNKL